MIKLYIKYESSFIKDFKTESDSITIGRKSDNTIVLDNPTVSGHHCKIYKVGDSYFIEDLNSTNGTFLNSKRIIKSSIKDKDIITIVKYSLIFSDKEEQKESKEPTKNIEEIIAKTQDKYISAQNLKAIIEIIENPVNEILEYELKNTTTYIGKQGRANIGAKASNIFSSIPELAAAIVFRNDGYYLNPLKEDTVKHNGEKINDKVLLKNEDIIEVGITKFKFILKKP